MTKRAITVMEDEFGNPGTAEVMVENVTVAQALQAKEKIEKIDGVDQVIWLDDAADITQPVSSMLPEDTLNNYYKDGAALFSVQFAQNDYSQLTGSALKAIRAELGDAISVSGTAVNAHNMQDTMAGEIDKVFLIVIPLCLLILILASGSWIEPLVYLSVIGVSIALNMGSNILFDNVSSITHSMASVLQLAISMDYSLFLLHRYKEERGGGAEVREAIVTGRA